MLKIRKLNIKNADLIEKPSIIFHVLYNNFPCVLLSFVFHLQKDFYGFTTILALFIFFFFRWILIPFTSIFSLFIFLFFRKILTLFTSLFLKTLFVFLIVSGWHFYICEKNIWLNIYICEKVFDWFFIYSKPLQITWNHFNHPNQ